jgi:hypothetical protein
MSLVPKLVMPKLVMPAFIDQGKFVCVYTAAKENVTSVQEILQ